MPALTPSTLSYIENLSSCPQLPEVPMSSARWWRWRTELHTQGSHQFHFSVWKEKVFFPFQKKPLSSLYLPSSESCMCEAIPSPLVWRKISPSVSKTEDRNFIVALSPAVTPYTEHSAALGCRRKAGELVCWAGTLLWTSARDRDRHWSDVTVTKVCFVLVSGWSVE